MELVRAEKKAGWRRAIRFAATILPLAYMGVMVWLSSQPGSGLQLPAPDYLLHAVEYAGLAVLLRLALEVGAQMSPRRAAWLAILLSVAFGVSDEWHQSFTPGRDASSLDVLADGVGAALSQGVLFIVGRARFRRRTRSTR